MTDTTSIADLNVRQQALDPEQSFIIQAPAGSGKTELLIQRFLVLLTRVQQPEEIIALTFTNKAALEMKQRVMQALSEAAQNTPIDSDHQQLTRSLALAALAQNKKQQWHLLENPHALKIQTLDAFCLQVCQNQPIDTLLPVNIAPADNPTPLYQQAIETLLLQSNDPSLQQRLKRLLIHCDNHYPTLERMLTQLISLRDQWLPLIMPFYHDPELLKQQCQHVLATIYQDTIVNLMHLLEPFELDTIWQSVCFSYNQLHDTALEPGDILLTENPNHRCYWLWLAKLLLTDKNTWRSKSSINKRLGFSTDFKEQKIQCQQLLNDLHGNDTDQALLNQFIQLRLLPALTYADKDWQLLLDCLLCLPELIAQTSMVFQSSNQCDFTEMTLAACRVLAIDSNSDKAIRLDATIAHILVDECQDTSLSQNHLLKLLTQNWSNEDHKTLFFVGDPMQSIYRFRQAEVTLFNTWQSDGLGALHLTPLTLTANFRSDKQLVHWFNNIFNDVFPATIQKQIAGIPYSQAQGLIERNKHVSITGTLIEDMSAAQQAQLIIDDIQQQLAINTETSIAILLQKRSQAIAIIDALKQHELDFTAVDIEPLLQHSAVLDWLMCLRVICNFTDKVAWLALLRSPICGLTLSQIVSIEQHDKPVIECILENDLYQSHPALQKCMNTVLNSHSQQSTTALWLIMQWAWQQLGFGDYYGSNAQSVIDQCQHILKNNQWRRCDFDLEELTDQLNRGYCNNTSTANIQLMTIHKSKGLEFDHVIIPDLQSRPMTDSHTLIAWQHIMTEQHQAQFCIAPLPSPDDTSPSNSIYKYCRDIEKLKLLEERKRLLYVAVTRAKQSLSLIASAKLKNEALQTPSKNTFAHMLWPWLENNATVIPALTNEPDNKTEQPPYLTQPTTAWLEQLPPTPLPIMPLSTHTRPTADIMQFMQTEQQRLNGIILHQLYYYLGEHGFDDNLIFNKINVISKHNQVLHNQLTTLYQKLKQDTKAQWVFAKHMQAASELTIMLKEDSTTKKQVVDRTFIADNTRWIIDFKSAQPKAEQKIPDFLQTQKVLYQTQLNTYASCFKKIDADIPIQCALYFPLCHLWVEWPYTVTEQKPAEVLQSP